MKHLAVIRFWYEGNAFSAVEASRNAFKNREWVAGLAAKEFYQNTPLEVAAVEDFILDNPGIEAHYIFCTAAYPAGPMETGLFNEILTRIEDGLKAQPWDGVYLSLHGSAVTLDDAQPETTLLRRVRELLGAKIPVAVSFDLHANLNPEMGRLANIICGYKTYPHVDMYETAAKALVLLGKAITSGKIPTTTIVPAGFAPTSFNMRTSHGPMADMVVLARQVELENSFYDVSVFGGFVYADTIDTGASISICADADAASEALKLASIFLAKAPRFDVKLPSAAQKLSNINQLLKQRELTLPVAVIEPSDNIFSGGGADTPGLLEAAIKSDIKAPSLFAFFWDPQLVIRAIDAGVGSKLACKLGGRLTSKFGPPLELTAQVEKLTDGKFSNLGPMEKNLKVDLGATAILSINNLSIIVTSANIPVNDKAYFNLHELNLSDFAIVYVKAKNHFRSAFEDQFSQIIEVETPGPAASDLNSFSFSNLTDKQLKPEIKTHPAGIDDAKAIATIHTSSWRDVYRNILPQAYLSDEIERERSDFWHHKVLNRDESEMLLVIKSGGIILGFIWTTRTGEPGYDAVIEALHIDANAKNCGYGKQLMKAAVKQLIEDGQQSVCLRVFDENTAAIKFYQHIGGIKDGSGIDNFAGANAADSRIGWKDIHTLHTRLDQGKACL